MDNNDAGQTITEWKDWRLKAKSWAAEDAQYLQRLFNELIEADKVFANLVDELKKRQVTLVVFGGWARDRVSSRRLGIPLTPYDIDLVVSGINRDGLRSILPDDAKLNLFGGFENSGYSVKLDIWALEDTYTYQKRGLQLNFDLLAGTTVFTSESIVFRPSQFWGQPSIDHDRFYETLGTKTVYMQKGEIRFPNFQVGRVLQQAVKLDLAISNDLATFIFETLRTDGGPKKVIDGIRQYGHADLQDSAIELFEKTCIAHGIERGPRSSTSLNFSNCFGVFEGGGVKGAALAGAYAAAYAGGVRFGAVAGTSAGSIIAALIAAGATPKFIQEALQSKQFAELLTRPTKVKHIFKSGPWYIAIPLHVIRPITWGKVRQAINLVLYGGMYGADPLREWVSELLRRAAGLERPVTFQDLKKPLFIVASDVRNRRPIVWHNTKDKTKDVSLAVRCSCGLPYFFQPHDDGDSLYVDGGLLANLPIFVYGHPDSDSSIWNSISQIIAFRLKADTGGATGPQSILDYVLAIADTVVDGATDIQLGLQKADLQTVTIRTGAIKTTDFASIDRPKLEKLFASGYTACEDFLREQGGRIGNRSRSYKGFEDFLLLLVRGLQSGYQTATISTANTYWLNFLMPVFITIGRLKTSIEVLLPKCSDGDLPEFYRRCLLLGFGAKIIEVDALSWEGALFQGRANRFAVAFSRPRHPELTYEDLLIAAYEDPHDKPAIDALESMLYPSQSCAFHAEKKHNECVLAPCPLDAVIELIKDVQQYRLLSNSDFSFELVPISKIKTIDSVIKEFRLASVSCFQAYSFEEHDNVYLPYYVELVDGQKTILTPPVFERHGDNYVLIEGVTRLGIAMSRGQLSMGGIVVNGNARDLSALPGKLTSPDELRITSRTTSVGALINQLDQTHFRHIEQAVHPATDAHRIQYAGCRTT